MPEEEIEGIDEETKRIMEEYDLEEERSRKSARDCR